MTKRREYILFDSVPRPGSVEVLPIDDEHKSQPLAFRIPTAFGAHQTIIIDLPIKAARNLAKAILRSIDEQETTNALAAKGEAERC